MHIEIICLAKFERSSFISFLEDINDQKSKIVEKNTYNPIKFFCEKRDGHSKRERRETIDLHLKRVFAE